MKIERIELHHVDMPLVHPFETSFGREDTRPCILIAVHSEGLVGWGECTASAGPWYSSETIETAWHVLRDFLIPAVLGQEVTTPDEVVASFKRVRRHAMARAAHVPIYGIWTGEPPAPPSTPSKGVDVYSVELGDITSLPTYTGLGEPMFGDPSSWRDMPADGFDDYHAQDVEADTPQIHVPWDNASPPGAGYGIISDGTKWEVSSDVIALASDLHDAVTLDADAATILDLQGAGGQEIGLDTQSANNVLAGPTTGAANEPTFRALVLDDLPLSDLHQHITNEDHSDDCNGIATNFTTLLTFQAWFW